MDDFLSRSEFPAKLTRLRLYVERLGVTTLDAVPPSDQARFIGVFEGHTITLFPQSASPFALWFTVAHLFGHMTQIAGMNERVKRANALVLRRGQELFSRDVQLIYDHEYEAAEIGRTLVGEVEPDLPVELDVAYTRFFLADFRYLINAIETGESGPQVFQRFWRREPIPRNLVKPDARPLLDMHNIPPATESVVVI